MVGRDPQVADGGERPVVVDGAEGFLGRAVVKALARRGASVRALVLDGAASEAARVRAPEGTDVRLAPLGEGAALGKALEGARAVVATRRLSCERPRRGPASRRVFGRLHLGRVKDLLEAGRAAGAERLLYTGIAGLDGEGGSPLARVEREIKAHVIASPLPALYLNLPLIVGPGDGTVERFVRKALSTSPVVTFVGQGWTKCAPLTREDFAGCVAGLAMMEDFPTGELDLMGPEKLTVMEILDRCLARAGRWKVKLHCPASVALLAARLAELLPAGPPLTREGLAWYLEGRVPGRNGAKKLLGREPEAFENAFPELEALRSKEGTPARGGQRG